MSVQLYCDNGTMVEFPEKFNPYSSVIANTNLLDEEDLDSDGSGDEENDSITLQLNVNASSEVCKLLIQMINMNFKENYSNVTPQPKKVTEKNFSIEKELGERTVEFLEQSGKDAIFAIANLADFLGIRLITHLCYIWIAHKMNTLKTKEKMDYLNIKGEPPTFEEIMAVDLKVGGTSEGTSEGGGSK